ncbi:hypothetical protein ES319_D08G062200v1 [Gossypium barbadense]|uniref:Uncharacterized protein n=1 Tax=Gossypium barbadense TaxID=3634 RepID=A0A5J5QCA0_GOSBA|nr:hypothetical protein ES319_D08G062200v1 [Gossypium barbadense]
MPSSLFFLNSSSPPAAIHLHRSTSGPPRFHPFPESEVEATNVFYKPPPAHSLGKC